MFTNYAPVRALLAASRTYLNSPSDATALALAAAIEAADKVTTDALLHSDVIDKARDAYAFPSGGHIEIDDVPAISFTEEGAWVSAWVLVPG